MNSPQTRYQRLEKLVLTLFIISRKFKYYFQTSLITVLMENSLRSVVKNPEDIKIGIGAEILRIQIRAKDNNQRAGFS